MKFIQQVLERLVVLINFHFNKFFFWLKNKTNSSAPSLQPHYPPPPTHTHTHPLPPLPLYQWDLPPDSPTNPFSPTILRASLSAKMEELPWAMLAKGPACTNTGVPCTQHTLYSDTQQIITDTTHTDTACPTLSLSVLHRACCCQLYSSFYCLLVAFHPSNMPVYLRYWYSLTLLCAATLTQVAHQTCCLNKAQCSDTGKPDLALTLQHQAPGMVIIKIITIIIIIILSIFPELLSMWNMLNCAEQVQIQKYKTHAYKTLKTVGVQIIMLKSYHGSHQSNNV